MSQQEQHPSADSQDKTQEIEGVVHNDKLLVCRHCNCKILRPGMGKLVENKEVCSYTCECVYILCIYLTESSLSLPRNLL